MKKTDSIFSPHEATTTTMHALYEAPCNVSPASLVGSTGVVYLFTWTPLSKGFRINWFICGLLVDMCRGKGWGTRVPPTVPYNTPLWGMYVVFFMASLVPPCLGLKQLPRKPWSQESEMEGAWLDWAKLFLKVYTQCCMLWFVFMPTGCIIGHTTGCGLWVVVICCMGTSMLVVTSTLLWSEETRDKAARIGISRWHGSHRLLASYLESFCEVVTTHLVPLLRDDGCMVLVWVRRLKRMGIMQPFKRRVFGDNPQMLPLKFHVLQTGWSVKGMV